MCTKDDRILPLLVRLLLVGASSCLRMTKLNTSRGQSRCGRPSRRRFRSESVERLQYNFNASYRPIGSALAARVLAVRRTRADTSSSSSAIVVFPDRRTRPCWRHARTRALSSQRRSPRCRGRVVTRASGGVRLDGVKDCSTSSETV